jgi:hypothetical protein
MNEPNLRIEKLGDHNYHHWAVEMKAYLTMKGLWQSVFPISVEELVDIVNDSTPGAEPLTGDARAEAIAAMAASIPPVNLYEKAMKDKTALSYIINYVRPDKKILIQDCKTAHAAWEELRVIYQGAAAARIVRITAEMATFKREEKETVAKYFNRYMEKRDLLLKAGGTFTDTDFKVRALAGLGQSFYVAKETLADWATDQTKSVNDLLARLQITEENLQELTPTKTARASGAANNVNYRSKQPRCNACGKNGHTFAQCKDRDNLKCGFCKMQGHVESVCYKKKTKNAKDAKASGNTARTDNTAAMGAAALTACVATVRTSAYKADYSRYDPEDFMLAEEIYDVLHREYGPFDIEGAADAAGGNAHLSNYCYKHGRSFLDEDVSGLRVYMNPPFRQAERFIDHYLDCKMRSPSTTSAILILPYDPKADWWPKVAKMKEVRHWDAGTQLFTLPRNVMHGHRRVLRPCHFPVVALYDAPTEKTGYVSNIARKKTPIIFDSGATHHMTPDAGYLWDYTPLPHGGERYVMVGNGSTIPIIGKGTMVFSSIIDGAEREAHLTEVLHVPDLNQPLYHSEH